MFVFLFDVVLIAVAFLGAFLLRFDLRIPSEFHAHFWQGFTVVMIVMPLVFLVSGLYRNLWLYASLQDGIEITKVVTTSSVISVFTVMYLRQFAPYPRSIFLLDWILLLALVVASRLVWRIYREMIVLPRMSAPRHRTLIVGAGEAGSLLFKEIRRQGTSPYQVVGFADDDQRKIGMRLHGVAVLGTTAQLKELIRKNSIEDVIIAIPSASGKVLREIIKSCERCKVRFKTLPGITDIIEGRINVSQIKDVEIEDLLGRESVKLDEESIHKYLSGKRVLVTGAAGSIGSEVCRQVARYAPAKLLLLDSAETPLYHIEKELSEMYPELRIVPVLADIRQNNRLESVFETFMPEVVFHAAAYKHVPMIEYNPVEAITNNIMGTRRLADCAHRFGVETFVMVSTDKAVNPTNIMGASKRVAELYVQALARKSTTKFTTVRFGNVLGSNGSVIPLFMEQIRHGGPVTVTHRDVIRFFMTIPEATQLVLQTGCIGNGGEIFVLDMGEPIRIVDLAEELISLSGMTPYDDIDIIFTGLRPGEKLFEELLIAGEGIRLTTHHKIKVLESLQVDFKQLEAQLNTLDMVANANNLTQLMESLKDIVPEFSPAYSFEGEAPRAFQRVRPDLFVID